MRLSLHRALLCIQLIVEGNSIRSTELLQDAQDDPLHPGDGKRDHESRLVAG
jgi:hypothetical protein